ncbi:hypothetical protein INR49_019409, partial [Caranx melampygus]
MISVDLNSRSTRSTSFTIMRLFISEELVLFTGSLRGRSSCRSADSELSCDLHKDDTAGQERFHALGPIYYRDSNGAILVYDITDEDSFQKKRRIHVVSVCAGNKIDLDKDRHVSVEEAE